ncbi:tetratricopeptide repeat protein 14-like isoform X2 [Oscarella lobularis]|uniref:tetratricopeptide repeat protein 14-like isoform X2 n=1 Tax=Oscarella lobularis TaxID=121494 RepID=UPI003313AAA9
MSSSLAPLYEERLRAFENRKRDALFELSVSKEPRPLDWSQESKEDVSYGKCFPLEMHLGISPEERVEKFFQDIRVGAIILGHVMQVNILQGIFIQILEISVGPNRHVKDLGLQALCPPSEVQQQSQADEVSHSSPLDDIKKGDYVRGVIYSIMNGNFLVSFRQWRLPPNLKDLELGLLSEEDVEVCVKRAKIEYDPGLSLSEELSKSAGFTNPHCVENLKNYVGIPPSLEFSSFLNSMRTIKTDCFYDELRSQQSHRQAMDLVASGVSHLKSGKSEKAIKHFDQALQIEPENVEAYVARGALHANDNNYSEAIKDFKSALKFNSSHKNAKKYLAETLDALGNSLVKKRSYREALGYFKDALDVNPNLDSAKESLRNVEIKMEIEARQEEKLLAAAKLKEKEEAKRATSLYKLRQLIGEEEEEFGPKPEKRKKKKKEKHRKKHKKEKKKKRWSHSGTVISCSEDDSSDDYNSSDGKHSTRKRTYSSGSSKRTKDYV